MTEHVIILHIETIKMLKYREQYSLVLLTILILFDDKSRSLIKKNKQIPQESSPLQNNNKQTSKMAVKGFERMQGDLERVIERDHNDGDEDEKTTHIEIVSRSPPTDLRSRLDALIHSHKFMVGVIVLVVLDCLMVIAELLFDLEIVKLGSDHHFVPHIFHYCSLAILSLFLIEVAIRIYVLRLDFLKHKLEVLDAIVVIVSWVLDIVFRNNEDAATGVGLLILLRLWRITRIINGIVLSVQKQADQKVEKERHLKEVAQAELGRYSQYCAALEDRLTGLEGLLKLNSIDFSSVPDVKVERPKVVIDESHKGKVRDAGNVNDAVVELNEIVSEVNSMGSNDKESLT